MSVVVPNTGAPGESRSRTRRVGPLGGSTTGRTPVAAPPPVGDGHGAGGPENGYDFLDAATQRAPGPYWNGAQPEVYPNGAYASGAYANGAYPSGAGSNGAGSNGGGAFRNRAVPADGGPLFGAPVDDRPVNGTGANAPLNGPVTGNGPSRGPVNGAGAATGRHAAPVGRYPAPDAPTTRQAYRGPGRQAGGLQPPHPGYLVDTPTFRYGSAQLPQVPARDGGPRSGASIGRRTLNSTAAARLVADPAAPAARLVADPAAPTEFIRRGAHSYAPHTPGRRPPVPAQPAQPPRRPAPGDGPGRVAELDGPAPSGLDRGRRTGGRRHHREGGRPATEFATTAPGKKKLKGGRRRRGTFWKELPILVVVALVLTCLIQTFLARVYEIPSGSMETTLHGCTGCNNDRVLVDKLSYHFGDPAPGDVVVFAGPGNWQDSEFRERRSNNALVRGLQSVGSLLGLAPPDEKDLIKRVIAVSGQTVACCDSRNRVTVDGKPLDEPYIYYLPEAGPPTQAEFGPVRVPDGQLWMMGDSRNNSADSRVPGHGPIPIDAVIGKARYVVLPFRRAQSIPDTDPQATTPPQAAR